MSISLQLGMVYMVSEIALRFSRRSGGGAKPADRGSLAVLWLAIGLGIGLGIVATNLIRAAWFRLPPAGLAAAVVVFAAALALRWWSILVLGKFFTVDVAISTDHRLIVRGPYRWVRHPSYTGMMLAFAAFAVTLQNWLSLACVLVPISLALAYRIRIEETALLGAFGDQYRHYTQTTKRLIPGLL